MPKPSPLLDSHDFMPNTTNFRQNHQNIRLLCSLFLLKKILILNRIYYLRQTLQVNINNLRVFKDNLFIKKID